MTTAFRTLIETFSTALLAGSPAWGTRVYVGREIDTPLHDDNDVNLTLETQEGQPFALTAGPTDWTVGIGATVRARGTDTINALLAADPLIEDVYARLVGAALPAGVMSLGNFAARLDVQEAATPVASWQLRVIVTFRTLPGSLSLAP